MPSMSQFCGSGTPMSTAASAQTAGVELSMFTNQTWAWGSAVPSPPVDGVSGEKSSVKPSW